MKLYDALKKFVEGTSDDWDVRRSDDNVRIGKTNPNNLGKSLVTLSFQEEEFAKIFMDDNDRDNNNSYYFNVAFSRWGYNGHVFVDPYYHGDEEWKYGACWYYFNEDNKKLFKSILKIVNPKFVDNLEEDGKPEDDAFIFMINKYNNEIDVICYEYSDLYDEALVDGLREYILNKTCDKFSQFGIYEKNCAHNYYTTVSLLLSLWKMTQTDEDENVLDLLHNLAVQNDLIIDEDLWDDYYAYFDDKNFNSESFNLTVERQLEKIKEKVEEELEEGTLKENIRIHDQISKLNYKFGQWYTLPEKKYFNKSTNKKERFKLENIIAGKIVLLRTNPTEGMINSTMTLEEFFNYLYHPELFESKK